jgi:diguanylate cyclase (GGDEF)-like protein
VKPVGPKTVLAAIAEHPWSSLRDFVVLSAIMLFSVLLAQHYDIFGFIASLAYPSREISPAEAVLLGGIGAACVWTFISRRLKDAAADTLNPELIASEMQALRVLAMQDPLTHLPNRRVLLDAVDMATKIPPPPGRSHAVFLLDLNGFKRVNDRYGHAVGDEVLNAVVARFRRAARSNDLFARLGGDEFAVLSRDVDEGDARAIGERFIAALSHNVQAAGITHAIGVAIGAALFPADGQTVETIMRHADVAMYRAKSSEQSSMAFFSPDAGDDPVARQATA